jgi:SAM-dependent methyltransferase
MRNGEQPGHEARRAGDLAEERYDAVTPAQGAIEVEDSDRPGSVHEVQSWHAAAPVPQVHSSGAAELLSGMPESRLVPIVDQLRSFHRRRIVVPVPDDALVLDVGSGDKPSWRADVLLERYIGAEHAGQRSGGDAARVTRPLFDADADDMPFADGVFEYAICSHVLEHVRDPAAVVGELTRVARAGYIEVPEAASAKIVDFPSHLWWCRLDESSEPATLVFSAKSGPFFDAEIHRYIEKAGIERELTDLLDSRFDHRIISLPWSGSVPVRVEGTVDMELAEAALHVESHHRGAENRVAQALTSALTWRTRHRRGSPPIRYDDIVKPEYRRGDDAVLERRIYRVGEEASVSHASSSQ